MPRSGSTIAGLCLLALLALGARGDVFTGPVTAVGDGDSLTVLRDNQPVQVRVYGIDAPELGQPYGPRAQKLASALADQESVIVIERETDQYGRTVGEVKFSDGRVLAEEMLKAGLAWWYQQYAPDRRDLQALEAKARAAHLGLWHDPKPVPPWEWRTWPWCASVNSSIYHPCSCPSVSPKIINPRNLIRFRTEAEAIQSGRTHCQCAEHH